jgi:hypothetical protein
MVTYCLDAESQSAIGEIIALARAFARGEPVLEDLPTADRTNIGQAARDVWLLLSHRDAPATMGVGEFLRDLGRVTDQALERFYHDDVAAF